MRGNAVHAQIGGGEVIVDIPPDRYIIVV